MSVTKVCEKCGKSFETPNRRSEQVKFCSLACKHAAGRVDLKCAACGVGFTKLRSEATAERPFCSRPCYLASNPGRQGGRTLHAKSCEHCKQEFMVNAARLNSARFCSVKCKSESAAYRQENSERQQGERHWRWAGGKYDTKPYKREGATGACSHRVLMTMHMLEKAPGHPFLKQEGGEWMLHTNIHVHHIDRNPQNNALENLLAVTIAAHAKIHHDGRKPEPWECWPPNPSKW